jgi:hypothetical protein
MSDELEPEWITEFRNAVLRLDTAISEFIHDEELTVEEAAYALLRLNLAKAEVSTCYDYLAGVVGKTMGEQAEIELPEGGKVEKKWSSNRTGWQHKDLASKVAKRIMDLSVDMDTGEVLASTEEMIAQLLDFVQPSYWRIKELQRINVNADDFCVTGDTKVSIIVRKGNNQ